MNFDERSRLYPERGPGKPFPVTTPLERTLLVILAIATAVGIGLGICLVSMNKMNDNYVRTLTKKLNEKDVCLSPSCIFESANLMKSMDFNVDPCTDFYSFVCGNWIRNNHLILGLESQFTKLTRNIVFRVRETLEDLEKEEKLPAHKRKTAEFYKACMDKVQRDNMGSEELLLDLKKFGGWPLLEGEWNARNFDWADLIIQLFKNGYISNMLFSVRVDADVKNISRSLISVSQPSLGLNNRLYYVSPYENILESYKDVIFKLVQHLQGNTYSSIYKDDAMVEIDKAFEIENKIAYLMKELDMKLPDMFYNIMTLEELEIFAPKIPWKKILIDLLPSNTEIRNEERIMVTCPSFIKGLNNFLEEMDDETGRRTLANYMFYRVVFNAANYLSREFYTLINDLMDPNKVGSVPWEICTKVTLELFPLPLAASYAAKYSDNKTKELLGMMLEDIRTSLKDNIKNSQWLDDDTKNYAVLKVNKMKAAIAYQDQIMDDDNLDSYYESVNITNDHFQNIKQMIAFKLRENMEGLHETRDRFKWTDVDNLLTANAYYRPAENSIIIPVGVLQDTIFAAGRPNYTNYGSLGMIVGHELTHAFDSIGSLYDAEGSYRMWWSNSSLKKFEDRMKCYEDQYNAYYLPVAEAHVNGKLTLAENIADNGGLKTAYDAYNSLLKRIGSEKPLPGFPYNERQMFWISFASVWCRKQTDESAQYSMKHSVHTPSQFRVIGSLSNIEEFSKDFNCKLTSTMNQETRCFLWK